MQPKTRNPEPNDEGFDAVELRAADWLARREFGLTPAEQAELENWIRENPRHARVLAELEKTSAFLDRWPETLPARVVPLRPEAARRRGWRRFAPAAGLAAALALAGGVGWRTLVSGRAAYHLDASTEIGGLRQLALPDGSVVQLNTDSDVTVRFSAAERRVRLTRGEASFTVAKNPARPFFVEAGGVSVRAVGTAFNVRLRPDNVEVLVIEGRVRVDRSASGGTLLAPVVPAPRADSEPVLSAGHLVVVPVRNALPMAPALPREMPAAAIQRALAWHERRLQFEATPLFEVVAEFNRYSAHKLVIADPTLAGQKFGGTFRPGRYETLISLLEQSFDVVADRRGNETVLRRRGIP